MGATAATPANLVVGAGDVKVDTTDQGVTADDNLYRIDRQYFTPDNLNGVPGALIGTDYIIKEEAVLEATLPEVAAATIAHLLPGWEATGEDLAWDTERRVAVDQYHDYELVIPRLGGGSFQFWAYSALNLGAPEFNAGSAAMLSPRIEAHSRWDAAALTVPPQKIVVATGS
jgi:predicted regulator of Ras-like GTPase activity (Roadblock/LC7/MglB family)